MGARYEAYSFQEFPGWRAYCGRCPASPACCLRRVYMFFIIPVGATCCAAAAYHMLGGTTTWTMDSFSYTVPRPVER